MNGDTPHINGHNPTTETTTTFDRSNQRCHAERPLRIVCIGAGIAGICFAYKLQRSFRNFTLTIFEKNKGIGGVWHENVYPGVACDVPAHNYTFSWEPGLEYTKEYASGREIHKYFVDFATKYHLTQYCKTGHEVIRAEWNELSAIWLLQVKDVETGAVTEVSADVLINAMGALNNWRWPKIQGLESFTGDLLHSAKWNNKVELQGKRVGLIGNGSSGQQLLTTIQPEVNHLVHFIRQPNWTLGPFGGPARDYTPEDISDYAGKSGVLQAKRKETEVAVNTSFNLFLKDSPLQQGARMMFAQGMKDKLDALKLPHSLVPDFALGCRRPTPGVGYLEALGAANVEVVMGDIKSVNASSVTSSSGQEYPIDALICATGFDTSYIPRFPIIGLKGQNLQDLWRDDVAASYLATAAPGIPNYLTFMGPFNTGTSGTHTRAIEIQADYMLQLIDRYQTENIRSFTPKLDASLEFTTYARQVLQRTVWADSCRSHYKAGLSDSKLLALWPGSCLQFSDALRELRADDWDFVYEGNRFSWLGNGFSATGSDPTSDIAWYISEKDENPYMSRWKKRGVLTKSGSCPDREEKLAPQGKTAD